MNVTDHHKPNLPLVPDIDPLTRRDVESRCNKKILRLQLQSSTLHRTLVGVQLALASQLEHTFNIHLEYLCQAPHLTTGLVYIYRMTKVMRKCDTTLLYVWAHGLSVNKLSLKTIILRSMHGHMASR